MERKPSFSDSIRHDILPSYRDSLVHHGIKGMHWGVRRYQNPDGTLTSKGKRRYKNTKKLYKDLKKQVHKQRAKTHGTSNGLMTLTPIGEHSTKYLDDISEKRKSYYNSESYKKWEKDYNSFQKKWDRKFRNTSYDSDLYRQYEDEDNKMIKKRPKKNFEDPWDASAILTLHGRKYTQKYLNGAGRDLSMAYVRDLGYSESTAAKMVDQMIKSGKTLGMD